MLYKVILGLRFEATLTAKTLIGEIISDFPQTGFKPGTLRVAVIDGNQ